MEVADILPAVIFAELVQMVKINMENSHIISSISFIPGFIKKKQHNIYIFLWRPPTVVILVKKKQSGQKVPMWSLGWFRDCLSVQFYVFFILEVHILRDHSALPGKCSSFPWTDLWTFCGEVLSLLMMIIIIIIIDFLACLFDWTHRRHGGQDVCSLVMWRVMFACWVTLW